MAVKNLVVIIEDNPDFQDLFGMLAKLAGFEVEALYDGREALLRLERGPIPSLVLLDSLLPNAGGDEIVQAARSNPNWARVPIYIVTADLRRVQRPASLIPDALQADGVIEKGPQAIHRLRELFEKYGENTPG